MQTRIEKEDIEHAIQAWLFTEHGWNIKGEQIKLHYDSANEEIFANVNHKDENYEGR